MFRSSSFSKIKFIILCPSSSEQSVLNEQTLLQYIRPLIIIGTSLVWLINGLVCKFLNFVPRHELIVSRILGTEYASLITKAIGIAEMLMVVWIFSGLKSRYC